jgi:hypothetical protein
MKHGSKNCSKEDPQDTSDEEHQEKVLTLKNSATSSEVHNKTKNSSPFFERLKIVSG